MRNDTHGASEVCVLGQQSHLSRSQRSQRKRHIVVDNLIWQQKASLYAALEAEDSGTISFQIHQDTTPVGSNVCLSFNVPRYRVSPSAHFEHE